MQSSSEKGRFTPQSSLPTTRIDDSHALLLSQEYHKRVQSLHQEVANIQRSLLSDDLIQTMRKDPTTAQFLPDRSKEIVETLLIREQEATIDRLISELATAKGEIKHLESLVDRKDPQIDLSYSSRRDSGDVDARLAVATKEIARARMELQAEMDNSAQLQSTVSILETRLQSMEKTLSRAHYELDEMEQNSVETERKLEEKTAVCEEMKQQVDSYEREVRELEGKYRAYSGEFREIMTVSLGKQSQAYKEKTGLFKQKILKQREKIKGLEEEQVRLKAEVDLLIGKNKALEDQIASQNAAYSSKSSEIQQLQDNHQVKIAEMQLSLQNTLEDRITSLKGNYEALLLSAKEKEAQLVRSFEAKIADFQANYMKKEAHELILSTEIEKIRKKTGEEKASLERELHLEANSRLIALKEEFAEEKRRFTARQTDLEADKSALSLKKKEIERQFEEAEARIRELNSRLSKSTLESESLTEQKVALLARAQETETQFAQEKELYDQEYALRLRLEVEAGRVKAELEAVRSEAEERKREMSAKVRELRAEVETLMKENAELRKELREIDAKSKNLEEEKTQTVQKLSRSSQEQIETLERLRMQEKQSFVAESDSFHQAKSLLSSQVSTLRRENELIRLRDKSLISKITKDYKEDLRELKHTLARDLSDFRRMITDSMTDALTEVDRNQQLTERDRNRLVTASKELLAAAQFDKDSLQFASQRDLQNQSMSYEQKIHKLETALDDLHAEVEGKTDQLEELLTKLEAFKQREVELSRRAGDYETDLKTAYDDLETWKNASFAVEEKNVELKEKMRTLEEVVEKLKARNEESMRFFDQEVVTLGEKYRITDQRLNDQFAKLISSKDSELLKIENELKSLKSTTISTLVSYESDLSLLVKYIQSDDHRNGVHIQRLQAENASQLLRYQSLQQQVREALQRAEEVQREKEALSQELKTAKEEIMRFQLKEVRVEMMRTEEMMRESSKDRGK